LLSEHHAQRPHVSVTGATPKKDGSDVVIIADERKSMLRITTERPTDRTRGWIGKLWEVRDGQWAVVWQCRGRKQSSVYLNVWREYQERRGLLKILGKVERNGA